MSPKPSGCIAPVPVFRPSDYRDLAHATSAIGGFIEAVYNAERLHSALDYLSPTEFEDLPNPWAAAQQPPPMLTNNCP